jgi:hypothetical protein
MSSDIFDKYKQIMREQGFGPQLQQEEKKFEEIMAPLRRTGAEFGNFAGEVWIAVRSDYPYSSNKWFLDHSPFAIRAIDEVLGSRLPNDKPETITKLKLEKEMYIKKLAKSLLEYKTWK